MKVNMKYINDFMILFIVLALLSCNHGSERTNTDKYGTTVKQFINLTRDGKYDEAMDLLNTVDLNKTPSQLQQLSSVLNSIHLDSLKEINRQTIWSKEREQSSIVYHVPTDTGWAIITANVRKTGESYWIEGFHANLVSDKVYRVNDFTLRGKSIFQYVFLLYALLVVLVTLIAGVLCIRAKIKRRWLWIIGIIISFPTIALNWTTAEISFKPLRFVLLGVSITQFPIASPWIVEASIPFIAIILLIKLYRLKLNTEDYLNNTKSENGLVP